MSGSGLHPPKPLEFLLLQAVVRRVCVRARVPCPRVGEGTDTQTQAGGRCAHSRTPALLYCDDSPGRQTLAGLPCAPDRPIRALALSRCRGNRVQSWPWRGGTGSRTRRKSGEGGKGLGCAGLLCHSCTQRCHLLGSGCSPRCSPHCSPAPARGWQPASPPLPS